MTETLTRCADKCIETMNLEKALFYKWRRIDSEQRNISILEVPVG